MQPVDIDHFADAAGIGEKNTVSNGPDDGANNMMAACFWQCKRHGTTDEAISNSRAAFAPDIVKEFPDMYGSAGGLNIGGHGNEGVLETGMGQTGPFSVNKWVATWTEYYWGPLLDTLKPSSITMISIWSCHSGAGPEGAELLFRMAERCGRAVRGRTGFTYTNGKTIWFEKGSVWQVATPGNKPTPIAAPSPHFIGAATNVIGGNDITADNVTELKVTTAARGSGKTDVTLKLDGQLASDVLASLFDGVPMNLDVGVMGFVTARLEVAFASGETKFFDIYNDRLAIETTEKVGYYLKGSVMRLVETMSGK